MNFHEQVKAPVIVVGCKLDLLDENQQVNRHVTVEQVMSPLMQHFREIEAYHESSAYRNSQVSFIYAIAIKLIHFLNLILKVLQLYIDFVSYTIVISLLKVFEAFYLAQKNALYPLAPLFDKESQTLKPPFVRALKRIFILCDRDGDGALSDDELNIYQVFYFFLLVLNFKTVDCLLSQYIIV